MRERRFIGASGAGHPSALHCMHTAFELQMSERAALNYPPAAAHLIYTCRTLALSTAHCTIHVERIAYRNRKQFAFALKSRRVRKRLIGTGRDVAFSPVPLFCSVVSFLIFHSPYTICSVYKLFVLHVLLYIVQYSVQYSAFRTTYVAQVHYRYAGHTSLL